MIRGHILIIVSIILASGSARGSIITSFVASTGDWNSTYASFQFRDSFEQIAFAIPGMSISLDDNGFAPTQVYTALPQLYDPSGSNSGYGSFAHNLYEGQHLITNFSYDPVRPVGSNWSNAWDVLGSGPAKTLTFHFSGGISAFGIGLANFQTGVGGQGPAGLLINGQLQLQPLEVLGNSVWETPTNYGRNAYLTINANGGDIIHSVGFRWLGAEDGFMFDALGTNSINAVPEPSSIAIWLLMQLCMVYSIRVKSRLAARLEHQQLVPTTH